MCSLFQADSNVMIDPILRMFLLQKCFIHVSSIENHRSFYRLPYETDAVYLQFIYMLEISASSCPSNLIFIKIIGNFVCVKKYEREKKITRRTKELVRISKQKKSVSAIIFQWHLKKIRMSQNILPNTKIASSLDLVNIYSRFHEDIPIFL